MLQPSASHTRTAPTGARGPFPTACTLKSLPRISMLVKKLRHIKTSCLQEQGDEMLGQQYNTSWEMLSFQRDDGNNVLSVGSSIVHGDTF